MTCQDHHIEAARIHIEPRAHPLCSGDRIPLSRAQQHYLCHVLRRPIGAEILVFDGQSGEWSALLSRTSNDAFFLCIERQHHPQDQNPDVTIAFAPPKGRRLDDMITKLTELGAGTLQPVLTERTLVRPLRPERLRSHTIAAAAQCGFNSLPHIADATPLSTLLESWRHLKNILFCDESLIQDKNSHIEAPTPRWEDHDNHLPWVILIGPEGGFTKSERAFIVAHQPKVIRLRLGPRILRVDTAAAAALTLWQNQYGDWR